LLNHLYRTNGGVNIHGPVLHSLASTDEGDRRSLFDLLSGRPLAALHGEVWVSGHASGPLVGGNLSMIAATCGTPWQLDARGALLFLEDVGEAPYRIDRMLQQLRDAGVFEGVAGLLLGTWDGCAAPSGAGWTLEDVLREAVDDLGVPVLAGLPFGHGARNHPLPIGAIATLDGARLVFPELPRLVDSSG
jgi:muramoyltetrapeptide carboxypeptidase